MFTNKSEKKVEKVVYKEGVYDISNNEYHSSNGISRSMLMEFKRSPYHYWFKYLSGRAKIEDATPAMNLGNAVHTLALEENKFDDEFYICTQATKPRRGSAPHEKMMAEAQGKIVLTRDEYLQAVMMAKAIKEDEYAAPLLEGCLIERSIYFTHKETGLLVKARPDAFSGSIVCDLKTTADAREHKFQTSAMAYGYFIQAAIVKNAMESIGTPMDEFVFICVEKEEPYAVASYVTKPEALEYGDKQFNDLMRGLKQCMDSNKWPSYGIKDLDLPGYAQYDEVQEIE
jgi:hypothetical protein